MDVFQKCREYRLPGEVRAAGVYPYYRTISSGQDPVVSMKGQKVIMLGSNNYLGLTNHPEVKKAAGEALSRYGTGCAGSRLLNGTLEIHVELEDRLAEFMGRESALSFSTGYQVNVGVLSCLLDRHDVIYLDNLDHASLLDGARLGYAKSFKFKHNDVVDLEGKLSRAPEGKAKMIAVDGVFSMEGDVSPLPELARLAKKYDARLMVDDAHGVGVFGEKGRGTPEHFGVEDQVDLVMGTFSKSLAAIGGFIAGDEVVIDYIRHQARAEIFSAAPPPGLRGRRVEGPRDHRAGARAASQALGEHRVHEDRARGSGLRHRRLRVPGDPHGGWRRPHLLHDGDPTRGGGRVRQSGHHPRGASGPRDDPHLLHGNPHPRAPRSGPRGLQEGGPRARCDLKLPGGGDAQGPDTNTSTVRWAPQLASSATVSHRVPRPG